MSQCSEAGLLQVGVGAEVEVLAESMCKEQLPSWQLRGPLSSTVTVHEAVVAVGSGVALSLFSGQLSLPEAQSFLAKAAQKDIGHRMSLQYVLLSVTLKVDGS